MLLTVAVGVPLRNGFVAEVPPTECSGYGMHRQRLQKTIGYEFKNPDLLNEAITHPSIAHENGSPRNPHNQRLEFLGDAVLQVVLTDYVYRTFPDLQEGQLTQLRAHLANRHTLFRRAQAIEMGKYLLLGKGEETSGGRTRLSNLADAFEALIGAIYIDTGIRAASTFIRRQFKDEFKSLQLSVPQQNPKGYLQELLQAKSTASPHYRVVSESGPDHSKHFEIIVEWEHKDIGRGCGSSKKEAEAAAAAAALSVLETSPS